MVRAIVSANNYRPGLTLEDAQLAAFPQPTLYVFVTADRVGTVDTWKRVVSLLPSGQLQAWTRPGTCRGSNMPAGSGPTSGASLATSHGLRQRSGRSTSFSLQFDPGLVAHDRTRRSSTVLTLVTVGWICR
jgi:hypothetical protein